MRLLTHYLNMRQYAAQAVEGESTEITMEELTRVFDCTKQNARHILRHMGEHGWIEWHPGSGRSNRSRMTLLKAREQVIYEAAEITLARGDWLEAIELVEPLGEDYRVQLRGKLSGQLGCRMEESGGKSLYVLRLPVADLDGFADSFAKETFDGLVRWNRKTMEIEPLLAHDWEWNEERTAITLFLRNHVRLSHGRELTARDVVHTLQGMKNHAAAFPIRWVFERVLEMSAVDDLTVHIALNEPDELLLPLLSTMPIVAAPGDSESELSEPRIGTGSFQVVEQKDDKLVLAANPAYFQGSPQIDRIELWRVGNAEVEAAAETAGCRTYDLEAGVFRFLTLNLRKPGMMQRHELRQALLYAIDREAGANELGMRCPVHRLVAKQGSEEESDYHPKKTRKLLRESGYQGEKLMLLAEDTAENRSLSAWLHDVYSQFGIRIECAFIPGAEWGSGQGCQEADMIISDVRTDGNPELALLRLLHDEHCPLLHCLDGATTAYINQALQAIRTEAAGKDRHKLLAKLENKLNALGAFTGLFHERLSVRIPGELRGLPDKANTPIDWKNVWFRTG